MAKYYLGCWVACLWLAWAPVGAAGVVAEESMAVAETAREPEIRHLDRKKDAADLKRIWFYRKKLPEPFYRRNNFAWARADIEGLEKKEYFAHSGIQDLSSISAEAAAPIGDISPKPGAEGAHFKTLCVNQSGAVEGADCWRRDVDTEYKILEDMASRLPDPSVSGHVLLFTELYPCPSCWNVMKQFLGVYTNVEMEVLYRIQ